MVRNPDTPVWNYVAYLPITRNDYLAQSEMKFEVFDKNSSLLGRFWQPRQPMGTSYTSVTQVVNSGSLDEWFSIGGGEGEVRVKMAWTGVCVDLPKEIKEIETPQQRKGLFSVLIHEVKMGDGAHPIPRPRLVVEMTGHLARATAVGRAEIRLWEVCKEFLFYVDNMDTDKLTISLVSDTKKERRVTKGAKAFGKALVFLLTRSYHLKCKVLCARFLK